MRDRVRMSVVELVVLVVISGVLMGIAWGALYYIRSEAYIEERLRRDVAALGCPLACVQLQYRFGAVLAQSDVLGKTQTGCVGRVGFCDARIYYDMHCAPNARTKHITLTVEPGNRAQVVLQDTRTRPYAGKPVFLDVPADTYWALRNASVFVVRDSASDFRRETLSKQLCGFLE